MINIARLKRKIEKHSDTIKVVSFDVFDTLLIRLIPTERVSQLAAENLSVMLQKKISKVASTQKIIQHRFIYQSKVENMFHRREWNISEWLRDLAKTLNVNGELLVKLGNEAELNAEESSLRSADNAQKALDLARAYGLKVIALSDMWLDQDLLEELLQRFGMAFDLVISSGTSACSKRNGGIFREVERRLGVDSNVFLHIGNKFRADYLFPRFFGWKAIWMPKRHFLIRMNLPPGLRKGMLSPSPFEEIIQALEVPPAKIGTDPFYLLSYNYLAPLLIIFSIVQWRRFLNQGIDTVLYIARDAYLMLYAYDLLSDLLPRSPRRYYIRLSRRIVAMAHPDDLLLNVKPLAGKVGRRMVGEWLGNFVIGEDLRQGILRDCGLEEHTSFGSDEQTKLRETCKRFRSMIESSQSEQISLIREYIKSLTMGASLERIGIIDTGWACTIQDAIRRVLDETQLVSGIYLGVSAQGKRPDQRNLKYGLLRDDFRDASHQNPIEATAGVIRMWDTLLREPTGSVKKLVRREDNEVYPELGTGETIGTYDKVAAELTRRSVTDGINDRRKGAALLIELVEKIDDKDFEIAATVFARKISTKPEIMSAKAILKLGFDEGSAGGRKSSLGFRSLLAGVSWYPGLLSYVGMGWISGLLNLVARYYLGLRQGNKNYIN